MVGSSQYQAVLVTDASDYSSDPGDPTVTDATYTRSQCSMAAVWRVDSAASGAHPVNI